MHANCTQFACISSTFDKRLIPVTQKNIQIIDGAINSTYEIYQVPEWLFELIFPDNQDVAFLDEVETKLHEIVLPNCMNEIGVWSVLYEIRVNKRNVNGIHGTLHLTGSLADRRYYPNRREDSVINDHLIE